MYAESSVALLGDVVSIFKHRVHIVGILTAVAPHLGAGASQDTEDAYLVLPQLLSDPRATETNVTVCWIKNIVTTKLTYILAISQAVLKAYTVIRRPRAQEVWEAPQRASRVYEGHGGSGVSVEGRIWRIMGVQVNDDPRRSLEATKGAGNLPVLNPNPMLIPCEIHGYRT